MRQVVVRPFVVCHAAHPLCTTGVIGSTSETVAGNGSATAGRCRRAGWKGAAAAPMAIKGGPNWWKVPAALAEPGGPVLSR
ncbi:hypothetical protein GCM10009779_69430 [Polymorphospora rubra]